MTRLQDAKKDVLHRRLLTFDDDSVTVEHFITSRSATLFELLKVDEKKIPLHVLNDAAKRAIALMEQYNATLSKDEEQKQLCLRLVIEHRRQLPGISKKAALSSKQ